MVRGALLLVVIFGLGGCFHVREQDDVACDDSFAMATVTVRDGHGTPVDGLSVQTIRISDGADLAPIGPGFPGAGVYSVLDDNNLRDLDPDGSDLAITIGGASFTAVGIGGGCHIVYQGPHDLALP
ncbi:MAG: hypothetical protein ABI678_23750 [Kofleriaceae bacterium]